jgi:hypothetical protein
MFLCFVFDLCTVPTFACISGLSITIFCNVIKEKTMNIDKECKYMHNIGIIIQFHRSDSNTIQMKSLKLEHGVNMKYNLVLRVC